MNEKHLLSVDDGFGNKTRVLLDRDKLQNIIGSSIMQGVLASAEIEGEKPNSFSPAELSQSFTNLPERILKIETE